MVGADPRSAKLVAECRKVLWKDLDANQIRAKIVEHSVTGTQADLVESLHQLERSKVESIPKLPEARKEALLAQAAKSAEGWAETIAALEVSIETHPQGKHVLHAVARLCCESLAGGPLYRGIRPRCIRVRRSSGILQELQRVFYSKA